MSSGTFHGLDLLADPLPHPHKMLLPLVGPGLPGTLLSSFLRFAQSILPAQAAGQRRWVTLCIHSLGGWASSFTTGMLEGTASCLASPDLTWPHLLSHVLPRGTGQLLSGFWLAVLLPAILGGVYQAWQPPARCSVGGGSWKERPAALPTGRLWPQLQGQGEQARLSGQEARTGMKRPFMAVQRPSVSTGAWPRGPVVRVSTKQTYLLKGRATGAVGLGESPQCPGLCHEAPCLLVSSVRARSRRTLFTLVLAVWALTSLWLTALLTGPWVPSLCLCHAGPLPGIPSPLPKRGCCWHPPDDCLGVLGGLLPLNLVFP